jgi:hypothetical protein
VSIQNSPEDMLFVGIGLTLNFELRVEKKDKYIKEKWEI